MFLSLAWLALIVFDILSIFIRLVQLEERRKLGLVRFSLAMDDMRRLVDQVGFAEHEDSDVDEVADSARQKAQRRQAAASPQQQVRALFLVPTSTDVDELAIIFMIANTFVIISLLAGPLIQSWLRL